jgi:cobalt-zinc-cadmium efflux system membrane fusion protein
MSRNDESTAAKGPGARGWAGRALTRLVAGGLALAVIVGLLMAGNRPGWRVPKFSELAAHESDEKDDWCEEHSVPESVCVECHPELMPKAKEHGWCRVHGIHECPLCNPRVAQLSGGTRVTAEDRRLAEESLAFAPRPTNGRTCRQQQRRIQFASEEAFHRLEIGTVAATRGEVVEAISATGELELDATKAARVAPRVAGSVFAVLKKAGDRVQAGEIIALVDSAEVGKAKGELLQSLASLDLKGQTLARLKEAAGRTVTEQAVLDAEAAHAEAEVRVLAAQQSLTNLGLPVDSKTLLGTSPDEAARRLRYLGVPEHRARSESNNLLPVRSPIDGEVLERFANAGEAAEPGKALVVVADTRQMWLTLNVRLEDAGKVRPGQSVRFQHEGHDSGDVGTVAWVSPAADERTRTVPVRVAWPNDSSRHHARTFGTAQVILRRAEGVVVPSSAIHWEGCCHVVFVRDKDFETSPYKVFHVRKVRPGASDSALNGPVTEVVATANSGILRSELLKNDLGAG